MNNELTQKQKKVAEAIFKLVSLEGKYKIWNKQWLYGKKSSQLNFITNSLTFVPAYDIARGVGKAEWKVGIGVKGAIKYCWINYVTAIGNRSPQIQRAKNLRFELKVQRILERKRR